MPVAAIIAAGLPLGFVLSRLSMVFPFVFLVIVFLPWSHGTHVLWHRPGWPPIYREGVELALAVMLKGMLSVLAIAVVVFTTPIVKLLGALRALRMPRVLVAVLSFLFRYLDLLADQSQRVRRARIARGGGRGTLAWRAAGGGVGRLFVRALARAERIYTAMLARGYAGDVCCLEKPVMRRADWCACACGILWIGAVAYAGLTLHGG